MSKYLVAIGFDNLDICLDAATSLQKALQSKGIRCSYTKRDIYKCVTLTTPNGTVEFISSNTLTYEGFTVGKMYDILFYISPNERIFMGRVKEDTYATNYLEWILEKEVSNQKSKFENVKCHRCKNLPICSIKDEYFDIQTSMWNIVDSSEHFKKMELNCDYFASTDPIFPCGHV